MYYNISDTEYNRYWCKLEHWQGTEEEILEAQRKMLEIGSFCLNQIAEEKEE